MGSVWVHRFAVLVAVLTLLLVIAGGLVTSTDAALSIPDWPLAWGKLVPPLEGGIRFEFTHRVLAATVAVFTLILAFWMRAVEPRPLLRRLAWLAVASIVAQALLGGATVRLVDPQPIAIAHACLAQLCFGILVAIVVGQSLTPAASTTPAPAAQTRPLVLLAPAALFLETILGAALRHEAMGLMPHIAGAAIATIVVMWAGLGILMHHMDNPPYRRSAMLMLSLTFSQVFLGMGAYMSRILAADDPQPMPMMIGFTVAHVAVGSLAFGAAVAMAMIVSRQAPPVGTELAHGGMVVA